MYVYIPPLVQELIESTAVNTDKWIAITNSQIPMLKIPDIYIPSFEI